MDGSEKVNEDGIIIGEIVNVNANESILGENGMVDAAKPGVIFFDPAGDAYWKVGEKVGNVFSDGAKLK